MLPQCPVRAVDIDMNPASGEFANEPGKHIALQRYGIADFVAYLAIPRARAQVHRRRKSGRDCGCAV